jgi:pimeloyl-ACP methyl ester carboxylesterase
MKAVITGITIGYDDAGHGKNVLVLVHGHPFDRSMWRPQVEKFSRQDPKTQRLPSGTKDPIPFNESSKIGSVGWRVIAPDLRGYGESSVISGKTTLDIFARDIAGLLDYLQIREVVLGGLSMGGQIVIV